MQNFRNMAVFATVVDAGTFTGAARRLGVAKSAVSKSISDLESELGVLLLHRTTRRITPTEAGMRFYEGCARMVATASAAESEVRDLRSEPTGLLRVSAPVVFGVNHVVPEVARFSEAHPRVRVEINLEDRFADLVGEGIDLAVRAGVLTDSSLIARELAPVTSVVCATPAYLERHGVPLRPSDLSHHQWVLYTPFSSQYSFNRHGKTQTVTVKSRLSTNSSDATITLLREGCGLSWVPIWIVRNDLAEGRLKVVLNEYKTPRSGVYAVYPEGKYILPRVRLFVENLTERFRNKDWSSIQPEWVAQI